MIMMSNGSGYLWYKSVGIGKMFRQFVVKPVHLSNEFLLRTNSIFLQYSFKNMIIQCIIAVGLLYTFL